MSSRPKLIASCLAWGSEDWTSLRRENKRMRPAEVRAALAQLGLSQGEAARLLGVRLRTMQRWVSGRPPMAEPAARALRAWCRLAERGLAWRTDGLSIELEDL